jgi:PAS domain S-box-containing protein
MTIVADRAAELKAIHLDKIRRATDRLFFWLMILQYVGGVVAAYVLSPRTYEGSTSFIHPHVLFALVIGAVISAPMLYATQFWPGQYRTRTIVSICQMLMSALLIHVSGGRIETHFHVFGSLAFLAFYRDWRILIYASVVVAGDHLMRGLYFPSSVYGVVTGAEWRFIEHACWVAFEDVILIASCVRGVGEVEAIAKQQAELEATNEQVEAKVAERTEELRETEFQKTMVFENALDGIVSANGDGRIIEINPAAGRIFGVSRHQVLGHRLSDIFCAGHSQDYVARCLNDRADSSHGNMVFKNAELAAVSESGAPIPIEVSMTRVQVKGSVVYTAFVRDISERKRLEEKLLHANKMESLGQLATGVAHEINTPNQYIGDNVRFVDESFGSIVNLIGGYRSALDEVEVAAPTKAKIEDLEKKADLDFTLEQIPPALTQALEGVERVGSIIRAMKDFAHPGVKSYTMVDVNRVIESTVMVARNEWKYVADVKLDLDSARPTVQGNPGELSQVILNLVVNSAQAIEQSQKNGKKGQILITSRSDNKHVTVTVTDDGCGIKDEIRNNIFDPFFTTKGVGVGTGQGLSITRGVIDRHNGEIFVSSRPGHGTTFVFKLPAFRSEKESCA